MGDLIASAGVDDLDPILTELAAAVSDDVVVIGSTAINTAFGRRIVDAPTLDLSVHEVLFRHLREQPGWSEIVAPHGVTLFGDGVRISMGHRDGPAHHDLASRSWRLPNGVSVASLPDLYTQLLDDGAPDSRTAAARIRTQLQDRTRPPLPEFVVSREIRTLAAAVPDSVHAHPDARTAITLAANAAHILSTLYGDPEIRRVGQIVGDLEREEYRVAATYHNGFDMAASVRELMRHLANLDADAADCLDALVGEAYSDAVYGNGRRRDNPTGFDELRSAELAAAHAAALGYPPARIERLRNIVLGTGFDEHTRSQTGKNDPDPVVQAVAGIDLHVLAQPESVVAGFDIALEDGMSARYSPDRIIGRAAQEHDVHIRSTRDGLEFVDAHATMRPLIDGVPAEHTVMEMFAHRLIGDGRFVDAHQYPATWTLDNPAARAASAQVLIDLGEQLLAGRITATRAYATAEQHAKAR